MLIAPTFIANIEEAKNHYDVRSIYSQEQGQALAKQMDRHVLQVGVKAARQAEGNITGPQGTPGGAAVYQNSAGIPSGADFRNDGDALAAALYAAAKELDEKDVPEEGRVCFVTPHQYYLLVQSDKAIHRDFGGSGSYAAGKVFEVAGIEIVKTNNLPTTNITASPEGGDEQEKYAGDFSDTVALVMHPSAVGTVKLLDLAMEMEYQIEYQGTLMVAKYAVGHGILRPESAVEIRASDSP